MGNFTNYKHRAAGNKPRPSKARDYGDGYLSRSSIAVRLGLKPQGGWITVQKAMCRIGYLEPDGPRKYKTTEDAAPYWKMHEELGDGDVLTSWIVWKPIVVEQLREAVAWVLANPGANPFTGELRERKEEQREPIPDGYDTVNGIATRAGVSPVFAANMMLKWGEVRKNEKGQLHPTNLNEQRGARKFELKKLDRETGEFEFFYIYPLRIVGDLQAEWAEREALLAARIAGDAK